MPNAELNNRGILVISLDFEMYWGLADCVDADKWEPINRKIYDVVPRLLNLFEKYEVHATWATVGGLMCNGWDEFYSYLPKPYAPQTAVLLNNLEGISQQGMVDLDRMLFAPELVEMVHSRQGQEIGTHTYSHFYCDDETSTPEQFEMELNAAQRIAFAKGYPFKAAVFPRNQVSEEYSNIVKKSDLLCYRGIESGWIAKIKEKLGPIGSAIWYADNYFPLQSSCSYSVEEAAFLNSNNIRNSRFFKPFRPRYKAFEQLKLKRYFKEMEFAAQNGEVYHMYWHPHNFAENTEINFFQMEKLLLWYEELKEQYGMQSMNMSEVCAEISD